MAEHSEHIVSLKTYVLIFLTLLCLTGLTTAMAFVNLGNLNIVVALAIAALKASLVVLIFMHLKFSSRVTKMFAIVGISWLVIMLCMTMTDYLTRGWFQYKP